MSHFAKIARTAAKAKARARARKIAQVAKADFPDMKPIRRALKTGRMPHEEGGKVEGVQAKARADRKPRTKKADGGSLGENIVGALPRRYRRMITPEEADVLAGAAIGSTSPLGAEAGASRALTVRPPEPRSRVFGLDQVAPPPRRFGRKPAEPAPGPSMDEIALENRLSSQMSPKAAAIAGAASLGAAGVGAGLIGAQGPATNANDTSPFVPSRPERRSNPDMVITAPRPSAAPVSRETLNADRLNELSLAQSRMGPPSSGDMPRNAAETAALRNMAARRALIESTPTIGGTDVPFDPNMKRGGKVKRKSKRC